MMVLLYFMDGVKFEMMKKHMPFLSSIHSKPLISEFGYSCACHATMYTSRYIEEHGTWFVWKKGDKSPYKWLDYIPALKYINFLPLKLIVGKFTQKFSKNSSYSGVPCLVNLPLKYWSMFEPCESVMWNDPKWKEEIPNMFTIIKEKGIKHKIVALHKGTKKDDVFLEEQEVDYKNNDLVYYFIGYTDNIMHSYGENAEESQNYFRKVDSFIQETYEKAKKENEEITLIAFSDHGHIELEEPKYDINVFFKEMGLHVNKYIHLIEANFARFWFRTESEKEDVIKVLKKMEKDGLGYILTEEYLERYHLRLNPQEHGEIIFYLHAPHEFTKTIWGFGKTVKSGHGFDPMNKKHYGIFCSNRKLIETTNYIYLTDILPTILKQLDLDIDRLTVRGNNIIDN